MFLFDSEALEYIFEGLESGFRRTPEEIRLFVVLLAGFLFLLVAVYLVQRFGSNRVQRKRAAALFVAIAERRRLSREEQQTLRAMARELSGWKQKLGKVAGDIHTFNRAAERYLKKHPLAENSVAGLRLRLGFAAHDGERVIHSTADLEEGTRVYVRKDREQSFPGIVRARNPQAVVLRIRTNGTAPAPGDPVQVYFQRKNGVFCFETRVTQNYDNLLRLKHSESIRRVQRRRFYRGRVSLPAIVKRKGSSQPAVRTYILELGGGGLTLFNPHKVFHPGEELSFRFTLPGDGAQHIHGIVQRIDRGGNLAHVEFVKLKDAIRDRILGFVLNRAMKTR